MPTNILPESQTSDLKSLRYAFGQHKDLDALACDCVGFANARGGVILLGIEDGQTEPPPGQKIPADLIEKVQKRIPQLTVNVAIMVHKEIATNGGEYLTIKVMGNQQSLAATTDGRYFLRVSDETHPLQPDDLNRLLAERSSYFWELRPLTRIPKDRFDANKLKDFLSQIRRSDRVSDFVKYKSDEEILEYYLFVTEGHPTHLGVLWVGRREDRASLLYAPVIQCVKYDEREQKVRKFVWDDYDLNPLELINAVWREVPDWKESYEIPSGLFRNTIPHYEEVVVRELLANALVHRPYGQRGDIFMHLAISVKRNWMALTSYINYRCQVL